MRAIATPGTSDQRKRGNRLAILAAVGMVVVLLATPEGGRAALTPGQQQQVDAAWVRGLAWLITHQNGDGSWRSRPGSEVAATATALQALMAGSVGGYPRHAGLAWLSNAETPSVDSLARKLFVLKRAGMDVEPHVKKLLDWRNTEGTWGAYDHFEASSPDTAFALMAILASGWVLPEAEYGPPVCNILIGQQSGGAGVDGGWSYTNRDLSAPLAAVKSGAILPTTRNLIALLSWIGAHCNGTYYDSSAARARGITWLITQRWNSTGGFYEPASSNGTGESTVFESALALQAIWAIDRENIITGQAVNYLLGRQLPDGSWNGDSLQTASVLRALPPPNTALPDSDGDGIPDDVEALLGTNPSVPGWHGWATGNGLYALASLLPSRSPSGGGAFSLTVTGFGFSEASIVRWNGANRATIFLGPTQLQAAISSADVATAGISQVTVFTPAPGGGTTNPLPFAITPFPVVAVANTTPGNGTVTSSPPGITCGTTCAAPFAPSTTVTLSASPVAGATFTGWTGACSGTGTCVVTPATTDVAVTATFNLPPYELTVTRAGAGAGTVTSTPAGIACGATCKGRFPTGTEISLTAAAADGSTFTGWGESCSGTGICTVTLNANTPVTATFTAQQHTLSVSRAGTGSGTVASTPAGVTCGATCTAAFEVDTLVTLVPMPDPGSMFAGWEGPCVGGVRMDADRSCTAIFLPNTLGLSVIVDNDMVGTGQVGTWTLESSPEAYGGSTRVSADPAAAYYWFPVIPTTGAYQVYVRWTAATTRATQTPIWVIPDGQNGAPFYANQTQGGGQWWLLGPFYFEAGTTGFVALISSPIGDVSADAVLLVRVEETAPSLTVTRVGAGTVTSDPTGIDCGSTCSASFASGTAVALRATPDVGSSFAGWGGDGDCADGVATMAAARACTATFSSNDLVVDNGQPGTSSTGTWAASSAGFPYGLNAMVGGGTGTYRWTPTIPTAGIYQVYAWWTGADTRSDTVPVTVSYAGGSQTVEVNQRQGGGQWHLLGTYPFEAGTSGYVEVSTQNGEACADAVRFLPE